MPRQNKIYTGLIQSLPQSISLLVVLLLALPAAAHKTEVSGDVAGIWHVEPNHSPKAGEPAQVWVALTQRGGKIIPLNECDCRLLIRQDSKTKSATVLEPPLKPTAAETYQGIPGATVTFPELGQYQLKLTGKPKAGANFQPFELTYAVTVARGTTTPATEPIAQPSTAPPESPAATSQSARQDGLAAKGLIGLGAIALVSAIITFALCQRKVTKL
ncbi:MAG: hypothetical protein NW224_24605 [Leptolyngbyaceae cyanobacterium bins.302]|nr:hypothetical protein [Leptolyngbyaceae cyanobacterium bins.302]